MNKKIIAIGLTAAFIIVILAFLPGSLHISRSTASSANVAVHARNSVSRFLSDEYFSEIDALFSQIKKENSNADIFNSSKKLAAKVMLNHLMDDLEANPDSLYNHRNFNRFFDTFDQYVGMSDGVTERIHYFRNRLNSYSGAPVDFNNMIDLAAEGKWRLFSAKYHRFNYGDIKGALNVKFISEDGRFEAIYNTETGKMVTDPANMGTYNYSPGSINPIRFYMHNKYDKTPWKKWGNVKGFSYSDIMRLDSGQGRDAEINNKKVERLIQKEKMN